MSLSTTEPSSLPSDADAPRRRPVWPWIAGLLALTATGICIYLAYAALALGGRVAGCGGSAGSDCSAVLASRWARWFGIPVGLPAAVVYLAILVALALAGGGPAPWRWRGWYVLVPLATLILAAASWFSGLQLFAIGRICWFCLAVHGCAILLAAILLWKLPHDWRPAAERREQPCGLAPKTTLLLVLLGLAASGLLVVGQWFGKAPGRGLEITTTDPWPAGDGEKSEKSAGDEANPVQVERYPIDLSAAFPPPPAGSAAAQALSRRISLLSGKAFVDVRRTPILGSSDADVIVVELFDYTCPHCRRMHQLLGEARRRYQGQLGVVPLVTPMDPACNRFVHQAPNESGRSACDLARLSLAIWQTTPEEFEQFHDWLLESQEIPSLEAARAKATELIGADRLEEALANPALARQLEAGNRLYHAAGEGTIPKLLTSGMIVNGEPESAERLFKVLDGLGIEPRSTEP